MNSIKIIFISLEVTAIASLALILWHLQAKGTIELEEALMAFMVAMAAIVFQKEQQAIEWDFE